MNLTSLVFLHSKIAFLSSTEAIHETAMRLLWSAMVCQGKEIHVSLISWHC